MKWLVWATLLSTLFSAAAFSEELKIDGTSKESFAKSVGAMAATVAPTDKEIFQKGLINLIVTKYPPAEGAEGFQLLAFMPQAMEVAHITLNGYTLNQILEYGRKLEITAGSSSKKPEDKSNAVSCLQRLVTVSDARIEKGDFSYYIKLNIVNNLKWPLAFVHVRYVVSTPGRSVPWSDETFGVSVSGGIEPGETRLISTNVFGIPSEAKNLVAKAEVLDVADAQKRQLVGKVKYIGNAKDLTANSCG